MAPTRRSTWFFSVLILAAAVALSLADRVPGGTPPQNPFQAQIDALQQQVQSLQNRLNTLTLEDLRDVNIKNPVAEEFLEYNGIEWVNGGTP
jgi:hypothetical protein